LVYEHYEHLYGLEREALTDALEDGFSPIVILNDVQMVRKVREALGETVMSVFVFREGPSLERYQDLAKSIGVMDEKEPVRRFLYAQAFYHVYGENIHLFDRALVNGGTFADLDAQVQQLVVALKLAPGRSWSPERGGALRHRLFAIVDVLGSAQHRLIQAISSLGAHQAQVIPEHTIYEDRESGRCLSASRILEVLHEQVFPVLVVDNIDIAGRLHEVFGRFIVLVYVHSEACAEDFQHNIVDHGTDASDLERRMERYRAAFDVYLEKFLDFDHVIIDSGNAVNLLDQLFWLFRAYERGDLPRVPRQPSSAAEIVGDRVSAPKSS
jgi:hypothetical protein